MVRLREAVDDPRRDVCGTGMANMLKRKINESGKGPALMEQANRGTDIDGAGTGRHWKEKQVADT